MSTMWRTVLVVYLAFVAKTECMSNDFVPEPTLSDNQTITVKTVELEDNAINNYTNVECVSQANSSSTERCAPDFTTALPSTSENGVTSDSKNELFRTQSNELIVPIQEDNSMHDSNEDLPSNLEDMEKSAFSMDQLWNIFKSKPIDDITDKEFSNEKQENDVERNEIEKSVEREIKNLGSGESIEERPMNGVQRNDGFEDVRHKSDGVRKWKTNYQSNDDGSFVDNEDGTSSPPLKKMTSSKAEEEFTRTRNFTPFNGFRNSITNFGDQSVDFDVSFTGPRSRNASNMRTMNLHEDNLKLMAPKLDFDNLPDGEPYEMENLGLTSGIFVFSYLGDFLSFIQPYDFPIELLRDALWRKVTVVSLILQSLKAEAGFVTCLTIGLVFSLVIPTFAIAATCSNVCLSKKEVSDSVSMNVNGDINCTRRTLVCILFIVIVMIGAGVIAMTVTNEQLSSAMLSTPRVLSVAFNDVSSYVRNAHRQLIHITLGCLDRALDALYSDLENIEGLLGKPIQREVAAETGVDVALDALVDVASVTDELAKKVAEVQEASMNMRDLSMEARDRLADLRNHIETLRRACPTRDRPLCDTIESSGLEITLRTEGLNSDSRLAILRSMETGNLPQLVDKIRRRFEDIPTDISRSTRDIRDDLKRELEHHKTTLDTSLWPIESLARDIRARINDAREVATDVEQIVGDVEQWRWLSKLISCLVVFLIWALLLSAVVYGCCDGEDKARSLLIAALAISSIFSIVLWAVAVTVFAAGGHGEVFVCRPLYDKPDYNTISQLLDDPGVIYQKGGGFFRNLLPKNQTLQVSIKNILRDCEENRPLYDAFRLKTILDLESATNYRQWGIFFQQLSSLDQNFTQLQFLDPVLQDRLQTLLHASAVNMTVHRSQISKPLTGKDLNSFAKQLDSVANQIKDLSTASRIETLASRTRRLISGNMQPLEAKKEEVIYLVTALEVQIAPLQRQVNQSISHLKTIQYYLNNQGTNISEMKVSDYTKRLEGYLQQYRENLDNELENSLSRCSPIWNVFQGVRHQMCRQIMDPLNGFWFALVWCLVWLAIATPICIKLIHYYHLGKDSLLVSSTSSVNSAERNGWTTSSGGDNNW